MCKETRDGAVSLFTPALAADRQAFIRIKMACYRSYVEQFYGPWDEQDQIRRNSALFDSALKSTLYKVVLRGETVGFWGFLESEAALEGFHIQLLDHARGMGIGSAVLTHMQKLSAQRQKPVLLKVFRTNPAMRLYERHGFRITGRNGSHFFMRLDASPGETGRSPAQ